MPSKSASPGCWIRTSPPAALIALAPRVPSEPVPDNRMPLARSPHSSAREVKKLSIGNDRPSSQGVSRSTPFSIRIGVPGGFR